MGGENGISSDMLVHIHVLIYKTNTFKCKSPGFFLQEKQKTQNKNMDLFFSIFKATAAAFKIKIFRKQMYQSKEKATNSLN